MTPITFVTEDQKRTLSSQGYSKSACDKIERICQERKSALDQLPTYNNNNKLVNHALTNKPIKVMSKSALEKFIASQRAKYDQDNWLIRQLNVSLNNCERGWSYVAPDAIAYTHVELDRAEFELISKIFTDRLFLHLRHINITKEKPFTFYFVVFPKTTNNCTSEDPDTWDTFD